MYEIGTDFGKIFISFEAISSIVGNTIRTTVGVNDVLPATVKQNFTNLLKKDKNNKGIKTFFDKEENLCIDIHLKLVIGINIPEFCKNLCSKILDELTLMIPEINPNLNFYIDAIE